jgi:hypothetical protein
MCSPVNSSCQVPRHLKHEGEFSFGALANDGLGREREGTYKDDGIDGHPLQHVVHSCSWLQRRIWGGWTDPFEETVG